MDQDKWWEEALANLVAGSILAVGQVVYSVFRLVFAVLTALAR